MHQLLSDRERFSCEFGNSVEDPEHIHPTLAAMWATDGNRHRDLRAAVPNPFRPRTLHGLEAVVRTIVRDTLDAALPNRTGSVEAVEAIANPIATRTICHVLRMDPSTVTTVRSWLNRTYEVARTTHTLPAQPDVVEFFRTLIRDRWDILGNSLIDDLIAASKGGHTVDGCPMSEWDLIAYCTMLLWAGVETTSTGIANALLFLTHFGCFDQLRAAPGLVHGAVEETLRWYPPFPGVRRWARHDTEIAGHRIGKGEWITGWLSAANRDPRKFTNPNTFDIRRGSAHLTFGEGAHYCLGSPLARLEMRVLLEELLHRDVHLETDPERLPQRRIWLADVLEQTYFNYRA
ncbi:cytochrome P450 [Pseudonocardia eucalypti]|uniref:cytochrome P450 n=1 Tax=Pseudonocardia eucalypti TaxID=648755 RepID=UPI001610A181|nr:cytochrome P450 [Pseudonocardia eucalypti]